MMQILAYLQKKIATIISFLKGKTFTQYMFFLALSTAFWFFEFSKETRTFEFKVPLKLTNVPENVVITTELPPYVTLNLKATNSEFIYYRYFQTTPPTNIDFETYANPNFRAILPKEDIIRSIKRNFNNNTEILSLSPDTLEYYYNFGSKKEVPIRFEGKITTPDGYYVSASKISPAYTTVYAADILLDTLTVALTEPLFLNHVEQSQNVSVNLQSQKGIKFVPDTANISFTIDRLIEKTLSLPIETINTNDSIKLRTFPTKINITFLVGTKNYKQISEDDFKLVVDASTLATHANNKCKIELQEHPKEVFRIRLSQQEVEYLIEETL